CYVYRYSHQRDLHSFPTRRSSDLASRSLPSSGMRAASKTPVWGQSLPQRRRSGETSSKRWTKGRTSSYGEMFFERRSNPLSLIRSEEHTSELQSLAYLVCRLLLEK